MVNSGVEGGKVQTHILRYNTCDTIKSIVINDEKKHLYSFEDDFPIKVNLTRFNIDNHLVPNFHDYFEIAYLYNGSAKICIKNQEYQLARGDMVIIGNNLIHTYEACDNMPADFIWIAFMPNAVYLPGDSELDFEYIRPFYEQENNFLIPGANLEPLIPDHLIQMYNLLNDKETHYRIQVKTHLYELLNYIVLYYDNFETVEKIDYDKRQQEIDRLKNVFEFMYSEYDEKITLEEAAEVACMSKHYFCKFFKKVTGFTFLEYLMKIRIDKAKELILQGKKSITEIAYDIGFDNLSYFYRTFKRLTRLNPGEYLQNSHTRNSSKHLEMAVSAELA